MSDFIEITKRLSIPAQDLTFVASRSSAPGGQHVNKVSTRITLCFDIMNSGALNEEQRKRILQKLKNRINKEGILRITSQAHRSQFANKKAAMLKFVELLQDALSETPLRKKTKLPEAVKQRRLMDKKRRSKLKRERLKKINLDDNY